MAVTQAEITAVQQIQAALNHSTKDRSSVLITTGQVVVQRPAATPTPLATLTYNNTTAADAETSTPWTITWDPAA